MTGPALDLDAIEARANAASPGPWATDPRSAWRRCHESHEYVYATNPTDGAGVVALTGIKGEHVRSPRDAAFIAAARTDVPALVAEIRRLRAEAAADVESLHDDLAAVRTERDALAAKLDGLKPVAFPSGEQLYAHRCNNLEWWHEPTQGPLNEQGCDACESSPYPDGWRPVYVRGEKP